MQIVNEKILYIKKLLYEEVIFMNLAIIGFIMLFLIVYLLFKGKATPMILFITIPVIAAFIAGFSVQEVVTFIKAGIKRVSNMAILFIFSVSFFGIMSDAGMFDIIVNKLIKKAGKNVILIAVTTAIVGIFSHLDGATVTTVLVTVPALLPIYKKMNIRPQLLLLITGCGMGVMNLLPWGGPLVRAATVLNMDVNLLWNMLIPIQLFGIVATVSLAIIMAVREIKFNNAGVIEEKKSEFSHKNLNEDETDKLKRPKLVFFNFLLTLLVLIVLLFNKFPNYYVFMIGCCVALLVNYPDPKEQKARVRAHAASALEVSAVMLAAGILVGILGNSGMLEAMTLPLLKIIPSFIAKYLQLIMGIIALPLGTVIGTDSYFYGIMPLAMEVGNNYLIDPKNMAISMLIGKNISLLISPLVPATFLAIGLADLELKDHIKYSIIPLWIVSLFMLIFAVIIGLIKI